ncbi:MAG: hypothetical protein IT442_13390 [Phycisphaeraceae bacterium]|nr:hypothetical protein [Phycisphaeraceae bacterium]
MPSMADGVWQGFVQPPTSWRRLGCVLPRGEAGSFDVHVTGDPCIVWDERVMAWRMFYFAMGGREAGPACGIGQALSQSCEAIGRGAWRKLGPIAFDNPQDLLSNPHKPWILMDPARPGLPVRVDGRYWLFYVGGSHKTVQAATAPSLDGPWHVHRHPIVEPGRADAFDGNHADAPTAWWMPERQTILIFYMGYPRQAQADPPHSPWGSSSAAALLDPGQTTAKKLGPILRPAADPRHWTAGWIGGFQILPAAHGGWFALINASPTPPAPLEQNPHMREPAPSLGGWAYTPEAWPVTGWTVMPEPIERIEAVPPEAVQDGEGVNLWRHYLLPTPDGKMTLYYNTGSYGREQMFARQTP